jgi:hypothetical protein
VEEGAGKGLLDKSSNAATANTQREAIRKRKRKQEHVIKINHVIIVGELSFSPF